MTNLAEILTELRREFSQIIGTQFIGLYLYGSQARGDAHAGSDIDVLTVIQGEFDYPELLSKTSEVVARLSLENDVVISRAFVSKERFDREQSPFLLNVCARTTEKLLQLDQIGVSDTTINRLIRDLPDPEAVSIRVLGVDDWAKRKRHSYGTILIDHERKRVVDILSDREAESVHKWLEEHPGVEIVTRDRGQYLY